MLAHLRVSIGRPIAAVTLLLAVAGCTLQESTAPIRRLDPFGAGDLDVSYRAPSRAAVPGLQTTTVGSSRQFTVYVPLEYDPDRSWPVAILLHGNGDRGSTIVAELQTEAEAQGVVLIAPNSARISWDLTFGEVGPDADYIEDVMGWMFDNINVDPSRLTLGGFSDGATYTAWLGLQNGDIFPKLLIMSGCARFPEVRVGMPRIMMLHGSQDRVFGVGSCVSLLLPDLQREGYDVEYIEFDGPHRVATELTPRIVRFIAGE
jgi:phospholipase/carboxylesterase